MFVSKPCCTLIFEILLLLLGCLATFTTRTIIIPPTAYSFELQRPPPLRKKNTTLRPFQKTKSPVAAEKKRNTADDDDIHFDDWISDAPEEINEWKELSVAGNLPDYLQGGTLIRNGGAMWSSRSVEEKRSSSSNNNNNSDRRYYAHIFDGLAKLSAYHFTNDGRLLYCNRFIQSQFYKQVQRSGSIPQTLSVGPLLNAQREPVGTNSSWFHTIQALFRSVTIFDNTCVNVWDYYFQTTSNDDDNKDGGAFSKQQKKRPQHQQRRTFAALTDTPARSVLDVETLTTVTSSTKAPASLQGIFLGYELLETAHPVYSLTGTSPPATYNVAVCLTWRGPCIALLRESPHDRTRQVVAAIPSETVPYFHSFGITDRHAIIVAMPLAVNILDTAKTLQQGFLEAATELDQTRVMVVELATGKLVLDKSINEKVFFYHTVSAAEYQDDETDDTIVSLRLCAYKTSRIFRGENPFMRLDKCQNNQQARNAIGPAGDFCDVACNLKTGNVDTQWIVTGQGFELPTTRYSRVHSMSMEQARKFAQQHPKYVYAYGGFALGSDDYDAWGLFKFEPDAPNESKRIASYYRRPSVYLSEPIFVPDPTGTQEDDGVLLSQVYDGNRQETALLILNAKNLEEVIAESWTGHRSPMDFHGAWFSSMD